MLAEYSWRANRRVSEEVGTRIVELYGGAYKGYGPVLFAEKLESRHEIKVDHAGGAAAVDKRRAVAGQAEAEKATPGVERAASTLWRVGADGRIASPLVRGARDNVLPDGDD